MMLRKILMLLPSPLIFSVAAWCATEAQAADPWVNPGTMGANAIPSFVAEAPWSDEYTLVRVGASSQWGRRSDTSVAPTFRVGLPFGKWVTAIFDGMPLEAWWSSPETRSEWALPRNQGVSKADIRFGAKLLVADFGTYLPKIGIRFMTKTTTGKDSDARRFTNGPGYLIDVLIGEHFLTLPNLSIDVYATAGFFAWQQGSAQQNDAVHLALAASMRAWQRLNLELQTRGYAGWQRSDKAVVVALRVGVEVTKFLEISALGNVGFLDAPRIEGRLDFGFRLPAILPLILNPQTAQ
jgi:hypothetical protein